MGRDFQPSVRGSVSTNCLLDIGISRPLPLAGLRCEVTRTREIPAMARIAENVTLDNDGKLLAFGDRTYFNYPAEFKPSDGSTPEPGELCRAHWSVRFKPGGRWVPVGRAVEFNFGATKTRMSEASANFAKPS